MPMTCREHRRFYENVFGWKFQPWGPPGFFLIATGDKDDPGIQGALQQRHEVVPGEHINGYECTISVADIDAAAAAVTANGGKVVLPKCRDSHGRLAHQGSGSRG